MILHEGKDHSFGQEEREAYLKYLRESDRYGSIPHVLLSTCDRVEAYYGEGEVSLESARHLFRVVSGLESPLLGEKAIQGQVKNAYEESKNNRSLSPGLHRLFQKALSTGKRVRTETSLSKGAMSHELSAIHVMKREGISFENANFVILGVNSITETIVKFLFRAGSKAAFISNRSYHKAVRFAERTGVEAFTFDKCYEKISEADVLITATSAPHVLVNKDRFNNKKSILIIDLAVPGDVDPAIGKLDNVILYNIEEIEKLIVKNQENRKKETIEAEMIVEDEIAKLFNLKKEICV